MRLGNAIGIAAALWMMGCAEMSGPKSAADEALLSAGATVQSVDQTTRAVTLRNDADGGTMTVTAGPAVRNLAQVEPGDHVRIDYYQSTAVDMAEPGDAGGAEGAVLTGRAPEGAKPGGLAVMTQSMVVTLVSYDRRSGLAVFRGADGLTRQTVVQPELRSFAEARSPGDRILVTLTDAVAVTITEDQPA